MQKTAPQARALTFGEGVERSETGGGAFRRRNCGGVMGIPKGRGHLRASGCGRPLWFPFWLLFVEQQKVTARAA